jgi:uncharacterized protein (TIGR02646 family)
MIYIDLANYDPSDEWMANALALYSEMLNSASTEERNSVIDGNHKVWKALKADLKLLSYGKCWFSEAREIYSHYHVDHFRPKKKVNGEFGTVDRDGYWWLTFDYTNFRLVGSVGNTKKGNFFAVKSNQALSPDYDCDDEVIYLLDPTRKNDYKKITFDEEGKVIPTNPNEKQWDHIRAKYTIEKMELDFPDLEQERQRKWKNTKLLIDEVDLAEAQYQATPSAKKEQNLENKIDAARRAIAPCEELSSTARACLRASRRDWALALLEENFDLREYCAGFQINEDE